LTNSTTSSSITIGSSSSNTDLVSSTQPTLNQMGFKKLKKINENDVKTIKDVCAQWICRDIRPFSIVDDLGLRISAQECIRLGKKSMIFVIRIKFRHFYLFDRCDIWNN
jgi:hypothetical protein